MPDPRRTPGSLGPTPESAVDDFHVASRNAAAYKRFYKAHEVHYEPFVLELVSSAPLRLEPSRRIALPRDGAPVAMSIGEAIAQRSSGRNFGDRPLPLAELATLLRLANGVKAARGPAGRPTFYERAAPNSGDLGSVEIFPVIMNVENTDPGIYHFDSVAHELAELRVGDFRDWLRELVVFQTEFANAAVALVLTGAIGRLRAKYGVRGYRFALLDVGHVSENVYLVATGLGLEVCATAGFIDDELDAALGLDGFEAASMLVLLVGTARGAGET